jgi:hypothetical protein
VNTPRPDRPIVRIAWVAKKEESGLALPSLVS